VADYYWISVAGNPCEPAICKDGVWYTLGCPDPLMSDTFRMVARIDASEIPPTPHEARNARRRELYALNQRPHGYMPK
jgi:hypothetical protein